MPRYTRHLEWQVVDSHTSLQPYNSNALPCHYFIPLFKPVHAKRPSSSLCVICIFPLTSQSYILLVGFGLGSTLTQSLYLSLTLRTWAIPFFSRLLQIAGISDPELAVRPGRVHDAREPVVTALDVSSSLVDQEGRWRELFLSTGGVAVPRPGLVRLDVTGM